MELLYLYIVTYQNSSTVVNIKHMPMQIKSNPYRA